MVSSRQQPAGARLGLATFKGHPAAAQAVIVAVRTVGAETFRAAWRETASVAD